MVQDVETELRGMESLVESSRLLGNDLDALDRLLRMELIELSRRVTFTRNRVEHILGKMGATLERYREEHS